MTDDIVTRLRRMDATLPSVDPDAYVSPTEAADEIEQLRNEVDQWRFTCAKLTEIVQRDLNR